MQQKGFGSPEGDRASVCAHLVVFLAEHIETLVLVDELGYIEVGDLEAQAGALGGDKDVVGLEVAVDDPVFM